GGFFSMFTLGEAPFSWVLLPYFLFQFILCLSFIFILNFIVSKNSLTEPNSLALFFFTGFLVMMPEIFYHENITAAHFFLLLAFRRVISLNKDTKSSIKIFETLLCISISSLLYFYYFLFIFVIIVD